MCDFRVGITIVGEFERRYGADGAEKEGHAIIIHLNKQRSKNKNKNKTTSGGVGEEEESGGKEGDEEARGGKRFCCFWERLHGGSHVCVLVSIHINICIYTYIYIITNIYIKVYAPRGPKGRLVSERQAGARDMRCIVYTYTHI